MQRRWLLLPCNGIGNPLSTISRYAAYEAAKLLRQRGEEVELLAIGRLLARLDEDIERAKSGPLAVIEACHCKCATYLLDQLGIAPDAYVYIPDVMRDMNMGLRGIDRKFLGPKGKALVDEVARRTADAVAAAAEG